MSKSVRKPNKSDEVASLAQSFQEVIALSQACSGADVGVSVHAPNTNVFADVKVASLHVLTMLDCTLRITNEAGWKKASAFAKGMSFGATSQIDHDRRVPE